MLQSLSIVLTSMFLLLDRLRHNKNIEVNTIDKLCNILKCRVEDIMEHVPDENRF